MTVKPLAFLKRDFLIATSYRLKFLLQLAGIFISTLMFFFLSRLVGKGIANQLAAYGGDYFAFVLIGIAFTDYLSVSLGSFAGQIRSAQMQGTLEALLVTPTSVPTILFSSSLYSFFFTSLRVILYLVFGVLVFGLKLHVTSIVAFLVIMSLTMLAFSGIGLLSAAFIIVFKQGSPIGWLIGTASGLLGGVFYPVAVLPSWLEPFAYLLPITHALEAMRQILLNGATLAAVYDKALVLALFAALLLPLGLGAFGYGLKMARKEGSLIHY
ncbi:MAG: ABC transporter permease [Desulfobacterales bacterium]|nr:ABC transporter permease [Desulfobacterales bacterium]